MPAAFQPSLTGFTLPAARPLVHVEVAMVLLDRNEDEVVNAIDDGVLGWAWNIGCPGAERRELRIWRDSLLAVLNGQPNPETDLTKILRGVLPNRPIRSTELQRFFSCSSTHITHLLQHRCLVAAGVRPQADGPNSFTRVTRESVVKFLTERREGASK